jgi:hypothetical protein
LFYTYLLKIYLQSFYLVIIVISFYHRTTTRTEENSGKENSHPHAATNKALWFFFTEERDIDGEWNIARCNTCSRTVKRKGASTTGMTQHLQINHPELQEKLLDMLKNDKRDKVKKLYDGYTERFRTKIEKQE